MRAFAFAEIEGWLNMFMIDAVSREHATDIFDMFIIEHLRLTLNSQIMKSNTSLMVMSRWRTHHNDVDTSPVIHCFNGRSVS